MNYINSSYFYIYNQLEDFLYGYYYYGDSSKKGFFFARETNWHEGRSTLNDLVRSNTKLPKL